MTKKWSKEEIEILKEYYPNTLTEEEIISLLPNRTYASIQLKASRLGINKFWKIERTDGFKQCVHCRRELPNDIKFFPPDPNGTLTGLRNVCRECGKDGHFMDDNYKQKHVWLDEENNLFIERYSDYTNEELIEIFYPNETIKTLTNRAFRLGITKSEETYIRTKKIMGEKMYGIDSPLYGIKRSEETKLKQSKAMQGKNSGENSYWYGKERPLCQKQYLSVLRKEMGNWKGDKNPRHQNPLYGESNGRWQGGITPINQQIRGSQEYFNWKIAVFNRNDHKCQLCGEQNNLEAHHVVNFSSNKELRFDVDNGISLCTYCHNPIYSGSFHNVYGTRNNNLNQLHEFFTGVSWSLSDKKIVINESERMKENA